MIALPELSKADLDEATEYVMQHMDLTNPQLRTLVVEESWLWQGLLDVFPAWQRQAVNVRALASAGVEIGIRVGIALAQLDKIPPLS